jgi:transitional endoplasmic reticulum ATPase
VTESVVSQILTELDGLEELKNVTVLAATNRPDMLDEALLRPGRLERHIYVPAPDVESRRKIFDVYMRDTGAMLAQDISVDELLEKTDGYVGADIEALVREAKLGAMREFIATMAGKSDQEVTDAAKNVMITKQHFGDATMKVKPSLDEEALEQFERLSWKIRFNQEERTILERAMGVIKRAGLRSADTGLNIEKIKTLSKKLRNLTLLNREKDFKQIKKVTKELEKAVEEKVDTYIKGGLSPTIKS